MLSDIQIAHTIKLKPISDVANEIGIQSEEIELYGNYKAKLSEKLLSRLKNNSDGKLVLVTAINPTPAGEGKTTVTIGLGQAMSKIGEKAVIALREPSLGPVFGIKGGATGGGYSQALPMEDINLHFTGDMHAITSANNLLCAILDNHLQQGNELGIDPRRILIKRCMDMNDRALRNTIIGLGGKMNGIPRENNFIITVATEIMAILCLSLDLEDLKNRIGNILVAYDYNEKTIYARDLKVQGAMAALLKDAIKPNLVQSTEGTPIIMHGGPFANIAHGCNSIRATKLALKLGNYCITEAGFGADLGAEKFLDIKCPAGNLKPSCVVIVSTVRSLKYNGGAAITDLKNEDLEALKKGIANLGIHINNIKKYGVPVIVTLNHFETDTENEIEFIQNYCIKSSCEFTISKIFSKGGNGGIQLAEKICEACKKESNFHPIYSKDLPIKEKILKIAQEIYRANGVTYTDTAEKAIKEIESLGRNKLPICIAKTQYSLSDDATKFGAPQDFNITVRDVTLSNGAEFIVVLTGNIMTMPGLPKHPSAENIDINKDGIISGIF